MDVQDLGYALTQVVHNFGAVAVVAGAAAGRWARTAAVADGTHRFAWLVLAGWLAQAISGATFGAISYASFGQFPEIHGIAVAALSVKIACAASGIALCALYLGRAPNWTGTQRADAWTALLTFGAVALCAAAFLRWFS